MSATGISGCVSHTTHRCPLVHLQRPVSVTAFQCRRRSPDPKSIGCFTIVSSLLCTGVCTCPPPRPARFCSSPCRLLQQEHKLIENVEGVLDRERENMKNALSRERVASARRIAALNEELETVKRRLEEERSRSSNVSDNFCRWTFMFYDIVSPRVSVAVPWCY